jgi:hypothetical protein
MGERHLTLTLRGTGERASERQHKHEVSATSPNLKGWKRLPGQRGVAMVAQQPADKHGGDGLPADRATITAKARIRDAYKRCRFRVPAWWVQAVGESVRGERRVSA